MKNFINDCFSWSKTKLAVLTSPHELHMSRQRHLPGIHKFVKQRKQESPANAKGTCDISACMKAHCEQM